MLYSSDAQLLVLSSFKNSLHTLNVTNITGKQKAFTTLQVKFNSHWLLKCLKIKVSLQMLVDTRKLFVIIHIFQSLN